MPFHFNWFRLLSHQIRVVSEDRQDGIQAGKGRHMGNIMYTMADEENYTDGQVIIKEGSSGDWIYVILSGAVEISKIVGGQRVVIEKLEQGEVFGELGFVGGLKRTATVTAVGDTTLGIIDRDFLEKEYNQLSSQFRSILETTTRRFKKILDRVYECHTRQEPRIPKVLSLKYKDRQAFVNAYTANASSGGLFIRTEKPLEKGLEFILKLSLPDIPDPLQIKAQVMWSRKPDESHENRPAGMGIMFMDMSDSDREALKACLGPEG